MSSKYLVRAVSVDPAWISEYYTSLDRPRIYLAQPVLPQELGRSWTLVLVIPQTICYVVHEVHCWTLDRCEAMAQEQNKTPAVVTKVKALSATGELRLYRRLITTPTEVYTES